MVVADSSGVQRRRGLRVAGDRGGAPRLAASFRSNLPPSPPRKINPSPAGASSGKQENANPAGSKHTSTRDQKRFEPLILCDY
jgi:hypothetical protein